MKNNYGHPPPPKQPAQPYSRDQIFKKIPKEVDATFKAAGILVYAVKDGKVHILLGCEDRSAKKKDKPSRNPHVYCPFGGKIEEGEMSIDTAVREFNEETAYIFSKQMYDIHINLKANSSPKLWFPRSKYVLYLAKIDYDETIPEQFLAVDKAGFVHTDQVFLEWVDPLSLFKARANDPFFDRLQADSPRGECTSFFVSMFYLLKSYFYANHPDYFVRDSNAEAVAKTSSSSSTESDSNISTDNLIINDPDIEEEEEEEVEVEKEEEAEREDEEEDEGEPSSEQ
eukprot:gene13004-15295_t